MPDTPQDHHAAQLAALDRTVRYDERVVAQHGPTVLTLLSAHAATHDDARLELREHAALLREIARLRAQVAALEEELQRHRAAVTKALTGPCDVTFDVAL